MLVGIEHIDVVDVHVGAEEGEDSLLGGAPVNLQPDLATTLQHAENHRLAVAPVAFARAGLLLRHRRHDLPRHQADS